MKIHTILSFILSELDVEGTWNRGRDDGGRGAKHPFRRVFD